MAEAPIARKRAVSAARPKATPALKPAAAPKAAPRRAARQTVDDEPVTPNYALRLTEDLSNDVPAAPQDSFALRLNEALEAINAANGVQRASAPAEAEPVGASKPGVRSWLAALEKLPPIRLPIGPAIPWKIGLPALVALVVVMGVMSRTAGAADTQGVQLPAQQTYPVQQDAPLFAHPQSADTSDPTAAGQTDPSVGTASTAPVAGQTDSAATTLPPSAALGQSQAQPQSIGVPEAAAMGGFDLMDIGIKLAAVLGLAYGSLMLLKKLGYGGAGAGSRASSAGPDVRVISSIALAPNRSVHVIAVPGGKNLLVGATPTSVNLLAELPSELN
ncbi:MAG: FliO/MopB family protein [Chloroflexi bacterium]|nr:FliO/MopB family protein [Chloroflexota bacterium]